MVKKRNQTESRISAAKAKEYAEGELLTIDEVCAKFKIGKTLLWELSKKKLIPFIRLGRSKRFPKVAIEEYCANEIQRVN